MTYSNNSCLEGGMETFGGGKRQLKKSWKMFGVFLRDAFGRREMFGRGWRLSVEKQTFWKAAGWHLE